MDPIDAALAALELQDPPNYTRTAKEFNVIRSAFSADYPRRRGCNGNKISSINIAGEDS